MMPTLCSSFSPHLTFTWAAPKLAHKKLCEQTITLFLSRDLCCAPEANRTLLKAQLPIAFKQFMSMQAITNKLNQSGDQEAHNGVGLELRLELPPDKRAVQTVALNSFSVRNP